MVFPYNMLLIMHSLGGGGEKVGSRWQLCLNCVTVTDSVKTKTVFSHLKFSVVIFLARATEGTSLQGSLRLYVSTCVSVFASLFFCLNDQAYNCLIHFYKRGISMTHHASCIMHHTSCIMHHESCIMHHVSCIMHHA